MVLVEEEINNMKIELEKYGIQMPAFSKIGGILANELSVDEAACKRDFLGGCGVAAAFVESSEKNSGLHDEILQASRLCSGL